MKLRYDLPHYIHLYMVYIAIFFPRSLSHHVKFILLLLLGQVISEKLVRENFLLCQAHITLVIRGAQLYGYLDGTTKEPFQTIDSTKDGVTEQVANPAHAKWVIQD
jgi:hypothetical protein